MAIAGLEPPPRSMLHDLGLVPGFDNHLAPFEDAGGDAGWVFGAGAEDQARRKPGCAAAAAVASGVGDRLAGNPLDESDEEGTV